VSEDGFSIPAAHIQDVDLSGVEPAVAAEIRRLGRLMESGDDTPPQFAQLVRLLNEAGFSRKAEYLLRRNLDVAEGGQTLYYELFGTEKPHEFATAIEAFGEQFSLGLELLDEKDFLTRIYRTTPKLVRFDELRLLSAPCEVKIDYACKDAVEADVCSLVDEQYMILRWVHGVWQAADGCAG
jgi:hypothetical protein